MYFGLYEFQTYRNYLVGCSDNMNCPTGEICLAHICRPHMDFPAITDIIVKTASCHSCNHTSRVEEGLQVTIIIIIIFICILINNITPLMKLAISTMEAKLCKMMLTCDAHLLPSGDPDWHLWG